MGKEVKIGLGAGCGFLLLVGIWYFGFHSPSSDTTPTETASSDYRPAGNGTGSPTDGRADSSGPATSEHRAIGSDDPLRQPRPGARGLPHAGGGGLTGTPADERLPTLGSDRGSPLSPPVPGGPAPGTTPSTPTGPGRNYTVQAGDSLWKIAQRHYRDPSRYTAIVAANPALKGGTAPLRPGMTLVLPELPTTGTGPAIKAPPSSPATPTSPGTPVGLVGMPITTEPPPARSDEYLVKPGDRFDAIIKNRYGSLAYRGQILALNADQLQGNADLLRPNMVLKLPPAERLPGSTGPAPASPGSPVRPPPPPPVLVTQPESKRFFGID